MRGKSGEHLPVALDSSVTSSDCAALQENEYFLGIMGFSKTIQFFPGNPCADCVRGGTVRKGEEAVKFHAMDCRRSFKELHAVVAYVVQVPTTEKSCRAPLVSYLWSERTWAPQYFILGDTPLHELFNSFNLFTT